MALERSRKNLERDRQIKEGFQDYLANYDIYHPITDEDIGESTLTEDEDNQEEFHPQAIEYVDSLLVETNFTQDRENNTFTWLGETVQFAFLSADWFKRPDSEEIQINGDILQLVHIRLGYDYSNYFISSSPAGGSIQWDHKNDAGTPYVFEQGRTYYMRPQ